MVQPLEGRPTRIQDGGNRIKIELRRGDLQIIRDLAATGAREGSVARALRMSPSSFSLLKRRDPRCAQALEEGRDRFEKDILDILRNPVLPDDESLSVTERTAVMRQRAVNCMFLAKAVLGWRDGGDAPKEAAKVNVQITLPPPAASVADYTARVIATVPAELTAEDDE